MDEDIVAILIIGLIVFTPVAGLTMRLALKPFIDRLLKIMEARHASEELELLERRIALLEQELHGTTRQIEQLAEQKDFLERLVKPAP